MFEQRAAKVARILLFGLETLTVAVLAVLAIFALVALIMELPAVVSPPFLGIEQIGGVLDHILAVFVLIELLATAVAYLRGVDVVHRIFEAMLVALARKLIGLDLESTSLAKAGALAFLIVAVGSTWWLVWRARDRAAAARPPRNLPSAPSACGMPRRDDANARAGSPR